MDKVVNVKLLSHPVNWLIVWTVFLFAGFAYTLLHERAHALPPSAEN
jgi:hypothetical protein